MDKKAIIFVDANNWYHNVKKLFAPSDIDICLVKDAIAKKFNVDVQEIRWYASMPSMADGELMYKKHRNFLGSLEKKGVKVITRKLQRLSNKEILQKKKNILENLDLCNSCKPLVESVFLDLADIKKKEKGIDVWIAVDIVRLCLMNDDCDFCVLLSGDADFVPALELVREHGKEVLVSMVPFGFSSELRAKFEYLVLGKELLTRCFRGYRQEYAKEKR